MNSPSQIKTENSFDLLFQNAISIFQTQTTLKQTTLTSLPEITVPSTPPINEKSKKTTPTKNIDYPVSLKCCICSYTFKRKHDLKRHHRTKHLNIKPHQCKYCKKGFGRRDALERHTNVPPPFGWKNKMATSPLPTNDGNTTNTSPCKHTSPGSKIPVPIKVNTPLKETTLPSSPPKNLSTSPIKSNNQFNQSHTSPKKKKKQQTQKFTEEIIDDFKTYSKSHHQDTEVVEKEERILQPQTPQKILKTLSRVEEFETIIDKKNKDLSLKLPNKNFLNLLQENITSSANTPNRGLALEAKRVTNFLNNNDSDKIENIEKSSSKDVDKFFELKATANTPVRKLAMESKIVTNYLKNEIVKNENLDKLINKDIDNIEDIIDLNSTDLNFGDSSEEMDELEPSMEVGFFKCDIESINREVSESFLNDEKIEDIFSEQFENIADEKPMIVDELCHEESSVKEDDIIDIEKNETPKSKNSKVLNSPLGQEIIESIAETVDQDIESESNSADESCSDFNSPSEQRRLRMSNSILTKKEDLVIENEQILFISENEILKSNLGMDNGFNKEDPALKLKLETKNTFEKEILDEINYVIENNSYFEEVEEASKYDISLLSESDAIPKKNWDPEVDEDLPPVDDSEKNFEQLLTDDDISYVKKEIGENTTSYPLDSSSESAKDINNSDIKESIDISTKNEPIQQKKSELSDDESLSIESDEENIDDLNEKNIESFKALLEFIEIGKKYQRSRINKEKIPITDYEEHLKFIAKETEAITMEMNKCLAMQNQISIQEKEFENSKNIIIKRNEELKKLELVNENI
ncbi:hypothetical protein HDU92_007257, partial [Lobulomyces angularis]